jgi:next-to-BRCA1 protein 1
VPSDQELTIERYSDSAGAYVVLDTTNVPVYKQLYRAAKAKSKLKLRVTNPSTESKPTPRPVTVEEVPDASASAEACSSETATMKDESTSSQDTPPAAQQPAWNPRNPVEVTLPLRSGPISKTYDSDSLAKAAKQLAQFESMRNDLTQRLSMISSKMPELPPASAEASAEAAARRLRLMHNVNAQFESLDRGQAPAALGQRTCIRNAQGFAVCCNSCDKTMPDVHYHCSTCEDGDFDLCSSCVDLGITCHSPSHWMIKRTTINGQIVNSTTEVIPPKPKKATTPKTEEKPKSVEPAKPATCYPPELAAVCYDAASPNPVLSTFNASFSAMRTCNNCIGCTLPTSFPFIDHLSN